MLFDTTQLALERSISGAAQRHEALAANIANAATPGYQRVDVDFHGALSAAMGSSDARGAIERTGFTTQADRTVNELIVRALREEFPEDGILAEESVDTGRRIGREPEPVRIKVRTDKAILANGLVQFLQAGDAARGIDARQTGEAIGIFPGGFENAFIGDFAPAFDTAIAASHGNQERSLDARAVHLADVIFQT